MKGKSYTFFIASNASGGMRRLRVPFYVLHMLVALALVGGITILAGVGSYSRMLLKATSYNSLRREQDNLKQQYKQLQTEVKDTNQRLNSLQSLASEVAMAYGLTRFQQTPFGITDVNEGTTAEFQQSVDEFSYLEKNASAVALSGGGLRLMPSMQLSALGIVPTLGPWSVRSPDILASVSIRSAARARSTRVWTLHRITATECGLRQTAWSRWLTGAPATANW